MTWHGPATRHDPILSTQTWRTIRRHWQQRRLPCARCHQPIDYDGPRYLTTNDGSRRLNPRALAVGHKIDRHTARQLGWTIQQINAITNTQPECQDCSNRSGARLGAKIAGRRAPGSRGSRPSPTFLVSSDW
jgi:hypothetical protein